MILCDSDRVLPGTSHYFIYKTNGSPMWFNYAFASTPTPLPPREWHEAHSTREGGQGQSELSSNSHTGTVSQTLDGSLPLLQNKVQIHALSLL